MMRCVTAVLFGLVLLVAGLHAQETPVLGGCCIELLGCLDLTQAECADREGQFNSAPCGQFECQQPSGACCLPTGECLTMLADQCRDKLGIFTQAATGDEVEEICRSCSERGACCADPNETGAPTCYMKAEQDCPGQFLGVGTVCESDTCPFGQSHCCLFGHCSETIDYESCLKEDGVWKNGPCSNDCPVRGSCCVPDQAGVIIDGGCFHTEQEKCASLNGNFRPNTPCSQTECDPYVGACCVDGDCVQLPRTECSDRNGEFLGPNTICQSDTFPNGVSCPTLQVCCLPNTAGGTHCINTATATVCQSQGGITAETCDDCNPVGRCCFESGACDLMSDVECNREGGHYGGDWTECTSTTCIPRFPCCIGDSCEMLTTQACGQSNGVGSAGTSCEEVECVDPNPEGGCCLEDGTCVITTGELCDLEYKGRWGGPYTTCDDIAEKCLPQHACCYESQCYHVTTQSACNGHFFEDKNCENINCGRGACCLAEGGCEIMSRDDCAENGAWQGYNTPCFVVDPTNGNTITTTVCPVRGGCCYRNPNDERECDVLTSSACERLGGVYRGDNTGCSADFCAETGYCCIDATHECHHLTRYECKLKGGRWTQGTSNDLQACYEACDFPLDTVGGCCVASSVPGTNGAQCLDVEPSVCEQLQGNFLGLGEICAFNQDQCAEKHACCLEDSCHMLTREQCASENGVLQMYQNCENVQCQPLGACCNAYATSVALPCVQVTEDSCNEFQGRWVSGSDCNDEHVCDEMVDCCLLDGNCEEMLEHECKEKQGSVGDLCSPNVCFPRGRCCRVDGQCSLLTHDRCADVNGVYGGDGTMCFDGTHHDVCVRRGACCTANGCYDNLSEDDCKEKEGRWHFNSPCSQIDCEWSGRCCFPLTGNCHVLAADDCKKEGGIYGGHGTYCFTSGEDVCPRPEGACCFEGELCNSMTQQGCKDRSGHYFGDNTKCDDVECEKTSACCLPNGECKRLSERDCGDLLGKWDVDGRSCNVVDCRLTGACCKRDGSCVDVPRAVCHENHGTYHGDNSACATAGLPAINSDRLVTFCPVMGACCVEGNCHSISADACEAEGGFFQAEKRCDDTTIDVCPVVGGCCLPSGECVDRISYSDCRERKGVYSGDFTPCKSDLCEPQVGCCFSEGYCRNVAQDECVDGVPLNGLCEENDDCFGVFDGACCMLEGCDIMSADDCKNHNGRFLGARSTCHNANNEDVCPVRGACCLEDGNCVVVTLHECELKNGQDFSAHVSCMDSSLVCEPVVPIEACCFNDGTCEMWSREDCAEGGGLFTGGDCTDDNVVCPIRGACCKEDGSCEERYTRDRCGREEGEFRPLTPCSQAECPQPTFPCCVRNAVVNANNQIVLHAGCYDDYTADKCRAAQGVMWPMADSCEDVRCDIRGACCLSDGGCEMVNTPRECYAHQGVFQGVGSVCGADGVCESEPCPDLCPNDPLKIAPGLCGCGTPDTDTDGDGTVDCMDFCPNEPRLAGPNPCNCKICDTINAEEDECVWVKEHYSWDAEKSRWKEGNEVLCRKDYDQE